MGTISGVGPKESLGGFEEHREALRRLARRLIHDANAVEDVLQEARLAAWRTPPVDKETARSWLFAVVRNQSLIANRRRNHARDHDLRGPTPPATPDPADELARRSESEAVHRCVDALQEPYRTVLRLRYLEGFSVREVCDHLARPPGTVRSQTKRGLALLRDRLSALVRDERPRAG